MANENGVIINVYVESAQSRNLRSNQKTNPIKKSNQFSSHRRVSRRRGYDRRAQLLAYTQELRHANAPQLQWHFNNSRRKPKKWRWAVALEKMRRLFSRFDGTKKKWKYESIVREDYSDGEGSCNQERLKKRRKAKGNSRRRRSHFCKKLRCLLKEISRISRAWKCKNGGC